MLRVFYTLFIRKSKSGAFRGSDTSASTNRPNSQMQSLGISITTHFMVCWYVFHIKAINVLIVFNLV